MLKFAVPLAKTWRSLPDPWPRSSWIPTWTSKAGPRYFSKSFWSSSERKVIFSLGALAERTFPRLTFLKPSFCVVSRGDQLRSADNNAPVGCRRSCCNVSRETSGPNTLNSRNVDSSGDTTSSKREHLKRGKVGLLELILLKVLGPRKLWDKHRCRVDEAAKLLGHLLVDDSDKALPLGTDTGRVTVAVKCE